ncbi:MAG: AlpA family phage regulatory protein [Methyloglobulus sp.]|nr:AlpA family phage regulatory protein [Methyloglobulus sp.]
MWRLPRVIQCVGLCKSSIYGLIKKGQFPQPIKLTEKASAWKASSVISWIKSREDLS